MSSVPVPTTGNTLSPVARAVRQLLLLERAREVLGGQGLADVLGISRRAVNYKLNADHGLGAGEMTAVAAAIDRRAAELVQLSVDLRGVA